MLIVGCGYVGRRVAALHRARGEGVVGVVRTTASAGALERDGVEAIRADLDGSLPALPTRGAGIYYLAPPPETGTTDPRLGAFLANLDRSGQPRRILYVGTTGIYGDCHGDWVDESRPANPSVDRARRRWDAESRLRDWSARSGGELVVLRVAGIYGPGRLPLDRLRRRLHPERGAVLRRWARVAGRSLPSLRRCPGGVLECNSRSLLRPVSPVEM